MWQSGWGKCRVLCASGGGVITPGGFVPPPKGELEAPKQQGHTHSRGWGPPFCFWGEGL